MPIIHLKNTSIYYEQAGTGVPILFLHGLGSSAAEWNNQKGYFSKNYRIIIPDLPGHGNSEKTGPYTIETIGKTLEEFIETLGVGAVHLVGLSYGSCIALQLAATAPTLVKSLTIAGATSRVKDIGIYQLFYRFLLVQLFSMDTIGKKIAKSLFPDANQAALSEQVEHQIASNDKAIYKALCKGVYRFDITKECATISCPTLIVTGEKDALFPPSHGEKLQKLLPKAQFYVLPGARHAVPLDSPEQFNRLLSYFLAN